MSIDRRPFENFFTLSRIPSWICPNCKIGVLEAEQKDIKIYESSESKSYHGHPEWDRSLIY